MAHQFPFIDTDHSQAANTIANLRADYAQFGVDSSVNLNLAGVGTFSNTVSFGATVNVTGTLVDNSTQVGAAGSILSSTGSGIKWIAAGEGNTESASNVGTNANATAAEQWVAFIGANSGNNPVRVDDDLRYNPSTNTLTADNLISKSKLGIGNLSPTYELDLLDGTNQVDIRLKTTADSFNSFIFDSNRSKELQYALIDGNWDGTVVNRIRFVTGSNDTDKDDGWMAFHTKKTGETLTERLRITDGGVNVTGICSATTFSGALTGNVTGNASGSSGSCTGNAATATALETARTIGGTSFDGTANINVDAAGLTGTPSIAVTNIDIAGTLTDKNDVVGTSGQILTSTEDGVAWASVGDQADKVKVAAEATDTTCFPVFALTATGTDIELKSNTAFKFNSATGELEASKFAISSGTSNQFLKGDGSVDTTTYLSSIADEAITLAKIQHIDTSRILGRTTASAGDVEVLTKADVLGILNVADGAEVNVQSDWNASSGDAHILNKPTLVTAFTGLSDTPADYTGKAHKLVRVNKDGATANGNALEFIDAYSHPNHTGDVTSTGDGATVIVDDKVTFAKMQNIATSKIIGRTTTGEGDPEALSASDVRTLINVADGANNYTHPTHDGDDIDVDTTALTGATVVSDIDINVTTDTLGHVTDANGSISTRTLTLADLQSTTTVTLNNTTAQEVDSVALSSYSCMEYTFYISHTSAGIQSQKLLVMDDGTDPYCNDYAIMFTSSSLGAFTCVTDSGNIKVKFAPANSGATTVKYIKQVVV